MNLPIITCETCVSACCRHMVLPPFVPVDGDEEWDDFIAAHPVVAAELVAEHDRMERDNDYPEERECFWLDTETNRCRHYEQRPDICRDFEVGGEDCVAARLRMQAR